MNELQGKTALVTGGSRGIGSAIAIALANAGLQVAVNYNTSKNEAHNLCEQIRAKGGKAIALQADVSDATAVKQLVETVENKLGNIAVCINNAGIGIRKSIDDISEADFDETIKVNLKSTFLVTQTVVPAMRKNKWGRIVFISSIAAQTGGGMGLGYAASKAGQLGMMHFYARSLATDGITVNAIAPAGFETEMLKQLVGVTPSSLPIGRFGKSEEIGDAVLMLVKNGFITNQTININGGLHPS